jgi:cobalamin biosynthesis protein CobT
MHYFLWQAPPSTKKEDREDIVKAWEELNVPIARVEAQANGYKGAPAATPKPKRAAKKAQKRQHQDSSDDESSDDDDDDDDLQDESDQDEKSDGEGEESGDESEKEETWNVKRILRQRGKGKSLQYEVEWEGDWDLTWEPAAFMANTIALKEYKAANAPGKE